jgi:hypothetical protein
LTGKQFQQVIKTVGNSSTKVIIQKTELNIIKAQLLGQYLASQISSKWQLGLTCPRTQVNCTLWVQIDNLFGYKAMSECHATIPIW